jgi:hypothetical protein
LNGLRVSEATGADIEQLGLERGHRTLTITRKGGKVVTVPLAPRTARAIDLAIGVRTDGPVFLAGDGRRLDLHGAGRIVRKVARGSLDRHATYFVAAYVAGAGPAPRRRAGGGGALPSWSGRGYRDPEAARHPSGAGEGMPALSHAGGTTAPPRSPGRRRLRRHGGAANWPESHLDVEASAGPGTDAEGRVVGGGDGLDDGQPEPWPCPSRCTRPSPPA